MNCRQIVLSNISCILDGSDYLLTALKELLNEENRHGYYRGAGAGNAGCRAVRMSEKEGPAERAGKEIDKAAEKAGEKIEKAGDKIKDTIKDIKK